MQTDNLEETKNLIIQYLKDNCSEYLKEGKVLYISDLSCDKLFDIVSPKTVEDNPLVRKIAETLNYDVDFSETIVLSPTNGTYVAFPHNNYSYLWSDKVKCLESFNVPYDVIAESATLRRKIEHNIFKSLKADMRNFVNNRWKNYLKKNAEDRIADKTLPDYSEQVQKLTDKWLDHYKDDIEKEIINKVKEKMGRKESKMAFDRMVSIALKEEYDRYDQNEIRFLSEECSHLHNDNMVECENNIYMKADSFFIIERVFYTTFIEDELWQ